MYVLLLPEKMSEQFKIEKEMKLDVLEKVAPSPLIFILNGQPGANFEGGELSV